MALIARNYRFVKVLVITLILTACGGGGGGGGSSYTGSFDPATATKVPAYPYSVTAGVPYTVQMTTLSGDPMLQVYDDNLNVNSSANLIGWQWASPHVSNVSFIAPTSQTIYATPISLSASSFRVTFSNNQLTVDGSAKTGSAYSGSLYYSFDAVAGSVYEVRLQPTTGNVNIGAVSPNTDMSASVGSSSNAGTQTDSVYFTAAATQRYYVRVGSTAVDSDFEISVHSVPVEPDLKIEITDAYSNGSNVVVNYSITNIGGTAFTGDVQADAWSDSASAPSVGTSGEGSFTHTGVTIGELGGTQTGSIIIANSNASGTVYAIVDTIDAIAEGDETNNVSSGVDWVKPVIAPVTYDFESATVPAEFTLSGNLNWQIDGTTGGSASATSLVSGAITDSEQSCFAVNVYNSQSTSVSFDRKVSSETFYDYLRFYIDGAQQASWSGSVAWGNVSYTTSSGTHEYKWCYTKDFGFFSGTDQAWVDNIVIDNVPTDLSVVIDSATSDGTNVTINYTVTNNSAYPAGAFYVDLWSSLASAPVVGATGETSAYHASGVAAYSSVSGSVAIANASTSGTAYAIVDTADNLLETNESNNVSTGVAWSWAPPVAAPISYNIEDGLVPGSLAMSGDAAWVSDNSTAAGGSVYSLRAGTILDSQSSCMTVSATGSTGVDFDYSVSSEGSFDFLRFYIDGVEQNFWSGTVAWTAATYSVASGTHTYKWCYTKDGSVSSGSDTAWVDNIAIN